ncbi:uncharacterized protein BKA55DRAFT_543174 [Fusarium redolens]|uniref:Uncharacterized protein n=1 Tax=Fusarium redolens TaxID=48865 RepID=A0A9P9GF36_FUSRE|nr:uncharacterized protein BKA55DRAFT_543174 [Fusarium redolens]KAH7237653.1 hypothetical protein BKA55DRAFT_543174 [Fusarium redolens]
MRGAQTSGGTTSTSLAHTRSQRRSHLIQSTNISLTLTSSSFAVVSTFTLPKPPPATQPLLNYAFPRRPAPEVAQDATPRKRRVERLDLPVSNERARFSLTPEYTYRVISVLRRIATMQAAEYASKHSTATLHLLLYLIDQACLPRALVALESQLVRLCKICTCRSCTLVRAVTPT